MGFINLFLCNFNHSSSPPPPMSPPSQAPVNQNPPFLPSQALSNQDPPCPIRTSQSQPTRTYDPLGVTRSRVPLNLSPSLLLRDSSFSQHILCTLCTSVFMSTKQEPHQEANLQQFYCFHMDSQFPRHLL